MTRCTRFLVFMKFEIFLNFSVRPFVFLFCLHVCMYVRLPVSNISYFNVLSRILTKSAGNLSFHNILNLKLLCLPFKEKRSIHKWKDVVIIFSSPKKKGWRWVKKVLKLFVGMIWIVFILPKVQFEPIKNLLKILRKLKIQTCHIVKFRLKISPN